ncbi:MAG: M13 family peptidase, partial [Bacteroidetes bacterium]
MKNKILLMVIVSSAVIGCQTGGEKPEEPTSTATYSKSVDTSAMETSVAPCNDFYTFSCGKWVKNNPVPPTEGRWTAFNEVRDRNEKILREILEKAAQNTNAPKGSNTQKIGDFYASVMDSVKRDEQGISPVKAYLDRIDNIQSVEEFPEFIAYLHTYAIHVPFSFGVEQDLKISDQYAAYVSQSGLGLPDRDFYFNEDPASVQIRELYKQHVNNLLNKAGFEGDYASVVMDIETQLAEASMNRTEQRDYAKQYNKMSVNQLQELTSGFDWKKYFSALNVSVDTVIVTQPAFMQKFNSLIGEIDLEDWKKYFRWHFLTTVAATLNSELEQENFAFYGTVLGGKKQMDPLWKRALRATNRGLGELVGQEYVKVAFSEEAKKRLNKMVDNLFAAFKERIESLDWMSEPTKKEALKKLSSIGRKIGYPDKWKDYSKLEITRDSYAENALRVRQFEFYRNLEKLGKPIDRSEWEMSPQTVNAYYHPLLNEIVFPAGILQPPFMDAQAEDPVLYATIGAVIGHELTHGFDDQGSRFDANGNMREWWTPEDRQRFMEKAAYVVKHYEKYEPLPGLHINGKLTLGENIADIGGLAIAYHAFQNSQKGKEKKEMYGYTPEQRFFIAFGQVWKSNYTEEALRQQVMTNPHSPNKYRVLGTLSFTPEFFEHFGCKEGDPM